MTQEDYVSYETAQLLKEKGFDAESPAMLYKKHDNADGTSEIWTACTLQIAMKWLRETHNIFIEASVSIDLNGNYHYSYSILNRECKYVRKGYTYFDWNYEQAVETALKYSLENLI